MSNYLIIHGHFYQPPREDPWLGKILSQESARPFHDWNERITRECYAANAFSRYLDAYGRILDIHNNYSYFSFNFGPTLLNWIKDEAYGIYKKIIDADKMSHDLNSGHGNAIAQAYNHMILPLASLEDIKTQILWGLEDFRSHFGRDSEGLWLPETAINPTVVDYLIECGVKFVILSPWQADAIRAERVQNWTPLYDQPAPSDQAFFIDRPGGKLAAFFYNPYLAQGISFEHYLRNADNLYEKLKEFANFNNDNHLINVATDGEVYGHHEPYGDMCLCALIKKINQSDDFNLTNYAAFLEKYPPRQHVRLKEGEDKRGSSWSCFHGVSRWYKDCGCSTGGGEGWNQAWRGPLRDAFNYLHKQIKDAYCREISGISSFPPYEIRDNYIQVLCGNMDRKAFAKKYLDKEEASTEANFQKLYSLLEGQKYEMFMYTSCAWFFSEVSGIETLQNMNYAWKAYQLYKGYFGEAVLNHFLNILKEAPSNIEEFKHAKKIFLEKIIPSQRSVHNAGAVFISLYILGRDEKKYGYYLLKTLDLKQTEKKAVFSNLKGTISYQDYLLQKDFNFQVEINVDREDGLSFSFIPHQPEGIKRVIHSSDLPFQIRMELADHYSQLQAFTCIETGKDLFNKSTETLSFIQALDVPPPALIRAVTEFSIKTAGLRLLEEIRTELNQSKIEELGKLLKLALQYQLKVNQKLIQKKSEHILLLHLKSILEKADKAKVATFIKLLKLLQEGGIIPDIAQGQNLVFLSLQKESPQLLEDLQNTASADSLLRLKCLIKLGEACGINVDETKESVFRLM